MEFSDFHFAHPLWLLSLLFIPAMWLPVFLFKRHLPASKKLETYIDKHLLPYLLLNASKSKRSLQTPLILWSIAWICLSLAMAEPRWNYEEIETFSIDQHLVILLDLSKSMDAEDVKPSRLVRAKQKIEDLINQAQRLNIGLIAFAADPHMITPLTDDTETIKHLLPSLGTDLVYIQGSRLTPALDMAKTLLDAEPGSNKEILVISDGGFEDASAIAVARKLAAEGVIVNAMGVGTSEGAPVQDAKGNFVKKNGSQVISHLEAQKLQEIGKAGKGRYLDAGYGHRSETALLRDLKQRADAKEAIGKKTRFWEEHFYLFIFPVLPILLWWFRKGYVIAAVLIWIAPGAGMGLEGAEVGDYFKNRAQLGKHVLEEGDAKAAVGLFDDPYRKGVAEYRAGNYPEAENFFRESSRKEVAENAAYNLGNTLVQQQKLKEAVKAYEEVLKEWPGNKKARDNLEIVKKMLEEEQKEQQNQESGDKQNKQQQEPEEEEKGEEGEQEQKEQQPEQQNQESGDKQNKQQQEPEEEEKGEGGEQEPEAGVQPEEEIAASEKSEKDLDADLWLNRISQDPKQFLKNKFMIESKRSSTEEGINPW